MGKTSAIKQNYKIYVAGKNRILSEYSGAPACTESKHTYPDFNSVSMRTPYVISTSCTVYH